METKIWTAYLFCAFTWRRDDPHATRERVYQVHSAPMFRVNINGGIVVGLPDWLTAPLVKLFYRGCLDIFLHLSTCQAEAVVSAQRNSPQYENTSGSG